MFICKNCEKYWKTADPKHGICSLPDSFFPVDAESECAYFQFHETTCSDCSHYANDMGCMTTQADDPACAGFESRADEQIKQLLFDAFRQGKDIRKYAEQMVDEIIESDEFKFLQDKIK